LARFERQEATDDRLADTLGAATEQLRAALEREALEIVSKARERAASIEEAARQSAAEVERQARVRAEAAIAEADEASARAAEARTRADEESARAEEARASHAERIDRLLGDVDVMEERMQSMVGNLRRRLRGELEGMPEGPAGNGASEVVSGQEQVPRPDPAGTDHAMTFSGPVPLSVATEVDAATERNPMLDNMMRAQIVSMAESGTTRADAERFLGRFKLGESYLGMLDEIYSEHHTGQTRAGERTKRRRFRRRGT
jgi:hypothetical protein